MRFSTPQASDIAPYAELLYNVYVRDASSAALVVGRPGFTKIGAGGGVGTQLGGVGVRTHQLIYQLTLQNGTEVSFLIVGGKLYTYSHGSDAFTESVTAANFAAASITLSTTARCYAVTFNNKVVVSDGVNKPFLWDGTAGAGGLTSLTNATVFFGQPWVRSARLCAIDGTNTASRKSFVWSEVGDATIGYGTAPYTANIWDVVQTSNAIFFAGTGTNDAMVIARANSVTRILGEIDTSWISTSTKEGVHEYVGSLSPGGMLVHQDSVYFFANDGRIMRVRPGAPAQEIAIGVKEFIASYAVSKFAVVDALVWDAGSAGEYLIWGIAGTQPSNPNTFLIVDPLSGELVGVWTGWTQSRFGSWKDSNGNPVLVHGGGSTATADADGYTYIHGLTNGTTWSDGLNAGTQAVVHSVTTHAMGWDETNDKYWDIAHVTVTVPSDLTDLGVQAKTPYGSGTSINAGSLTGSGDLWGSFLWGTGQWASISSERQIAAGIGTSGRWCQMTVSHATVGEQFAVQSVACRATDDTDSPMIA